MTKSPHTHFDIYFLECNTRFCIINTSSNCNITMKYGFGHPAHWPHLAGDFSDPCAHNSCQIAESLLDTQPIAYNSVVILVSELCPLLHR
jgi:hypothetical protein